VIKNIIETIQTNAKIFSSQVNELLGKSADNIAKTQRLVDDLAAGMKKVSQWKLNSNCSVQFIISILAYGR
jgi:uncharacterized protein YoxC